MKIYTFILLVFFPALTFSQDTNIGSWLQDENNLPCFSYNGALPFKATLKNGKKVKLPEDPWFLLGNYRLTLFTHVSGSYQLITGERAWGRMNQGENPNTGSNSSEIKIIGSKGKISQTHLLTGMNSIAVDPAKCKRIFGCGFARYDYDVDQIKCSKVFSVKPSAKPNEGASAFLLKITLINKGAKPVRLIYSESVTANYEMMQQQNAPAGERKIKYKNTVYQDQDKKIIKADIRGITDDPFTFPDASTISPYDGYPPSLFLKVIASPVKDKLINEPLENKNKLSANFEIQLKPGEEKTITIAIGYAFKNEFSSIDSLCRFLTGPSMEKREVVKNVFNSDAAFSAEWKNTLPSLDKEKDPVLKREMIWNAYNLEAMATYNDFYKETQIPQGTCYDYDWGLHASARDHFQHALPLCYYNPKLAKSILHYLMKRTTAWGEIRLVEYGYGVSNHGSYFTSDQQLFYFMLLSEYLRITGDYDFLLEEVETYPVQNGAKINSIENIENCFRFLKDEIGTGNHNLIRLMNSDWNDAVYYILKEPYNSTLYKGESHMNSAMAVSIFENLLPSLLKIETDPKFSQNKKKISNLIQGISYYRKSVLDAFMKDLGSRNFSRRMYFAGRTYGEDNMFLEPQGYMLQFSELSQERKKILYEEIKKRLMNGEKLGAREQQAPEFEDPGLEKGSRENGGFWYALHGPVILGVSTFDKEEAFRLLKQMSFDNLSKNFPQYWSSYWSAADNLESSLIPEEGLPDQTWTYNDSPVYCAHAHAWPLYCYFKLIE